MIREAEPRSCAGTGGRGSAKSTLYERVRVMSKRGRVRQRKRQLSDERGRVD